MKNLPVGEQKLSIVIHGKVVAPLFAELRRNRIRCGQSDIQIDAVVGMNEQHSPCECKFSRAAYSSGEAAQKSFNETFLVAEARIDRRMDIDGHARSCPALDGHAANKCERELLVEAKGLERQRRV